MKMTGKELVIETMKHNAVDRIPWIPFAGVHAGKLTNYNATELLKDKDKLLESLIAVHDLYKPDGQPVLFDLQIEAEILGCELQWAEKAPPSVRTHPLASDGTIPGKIHTEDDGRLPMILDVMKEMKTKIGDKTALYGLICEPFTLASHLRGQEIFMEMFLDTDYVHRSVHIGFSHMCSLHIYA